MNYIVFIMLCMALTFILPTLYAKRVGLIVACVFSIPLSIGITGATMFSLDLDCEPVIEEYFKSSYETTIDKEDISDILNSCDKNTKLLDLNINEIPKSKSTYVKMKVRVGKYIYRDIENNYTIGVDNNNVFVKKDNN